MNRGILLFALFLTCWLFLHRASANIYSSELETNTFTDTLGCEQRLLRVTNFDTLKHLDHLQTLDLDIDFDPDSQNELATELNKFTNLRTLHLHGRKITDLTIAKLSLPRLEALYLNSIAAHGTGFEIAEVLPKLRCLDMSNCSLSPEGMRCIGRLPLVSLSLAGSTTGITELEFKLLGSYRLLRKLNLARAKCTEGVLKHLPDKLEDLDLSGCQFPDGISSLSRLKHLRRLVLVNTGLKPSSAVTINNFSSLEYLYLPQDNSIDQWLEKLQSLTNIRELPLTPIEFSQKTGRLLSTFKLLEELDLSTINTPTSFFPYLSSFHNLRKLRLSGHRKIDDSVQIGWKALSKLHVLDLSMTNVGDATVSKLEALPLQSLSLNHTKITSSALKSVGKIHSLRKLDLGDNPGIGKELSYLKLQQLNYLSFFRCSITDQQLANLPSLPHLCNFGIAINPITDKSIEKLLSIHPCKSLDISITGISPPGYRRLRIGLKSCIIENNAIYSPPLQFNKDR